MEKRLILFLFFIISFISGYADPNVIVVTSTKDYFDLHASVSLNLHVLGSKFLKTSVACNIEVLDSHSNTVFEAKYLLNDLTTTLNLVLPDSCKQGKYYCTVYLYDDLNDSYVGSFSSLNRKYVLQYEYIVAVPATSVLRVYSYNGLLFEFDIDGDRPLFNGLGQASISPNGKYIVLITNRVASNNVYLDFYEGI